MKKSLLTLSMAVCAIALISCNSNNGQSSDATTAVEPSDLKVAYVEVDSLLSQYNFCKDFTLILQKKGQNIQTTLGQKQQALQNAANNFQQKIQQNAYTQAEAERIQASLQKQSVDLQSLEQRLTTEFQNETEKYQTALRDSLQNFLKKYNADKKFTLILTKTGDNILLADSTLDITADVVAGLNKAYKQIPEAKATKEEKK